MSDLGLELLKLVDDRALEKRDHDEKVRKQLSRSIEKLEKSQERFGNILENLEKKLRNRVSNRNLRSIIARIFLPWQRYVDKRQLQLIEVLISRHNAESKEHLQAMTSLTERFDYRSTQ